MPDERCLLDAGMPEAQCSRVMACLQAGNTREASAILKAWRMELLNRLHCCQKQIDCLDYFLQTCREERL